MSTTVVPLRVPIPSFRVFAPAQVFGAALAPEFELVLTCAQPVLNQATVASVEALVHRNLDWKHLTRLALSHGLSPLVYTRLEPFLSRPLPGDVLKLKTDAVLLTEHALIHTGEMKRLVPYLQANGIETLVFKGPALAQGLYGRIGLRPFLDLDLFVQPRDVAKAWSLLAAEGYTLEYNMSREDLPELMKAGNHLPLHGANHNECVELHWTFFAKTRATFFDSDGAWSRRVPVVIQDVAVKTLAPHDLVHFLCLHGTKHVWSRLAWLADLVWFIYKYPCFDWDALLAEAHENGTRRMVLVGLALAHELFGSVPNDAVIRLTHQDKEVLPLAKWMWQRVLDGNLDLLTGRDLVRMVLWTRERSRDRGRDLYYHLTALRPNNIQDASHSPSMPGTYALHRLVYLMRKYGRVRSLDGQD